MEQIEVVNESNETNFQNNVNAFLSEGYKISSTSCGFIDSADYDYSPCFMAILVKRIDR